MRVLRVVSQVVVLALMAGAAQAAPISYIFTGTGSGAIGQVSFSDVLVTVVATGDTDDVSGGDVLFNQNIASTVSIGGVGTFSISNETYVFDNQPDEKVGFGVKNIPVCCDIIQHQLPIYGTYDLRTALGPIPFAPQNLSIGDWIDVPTSGGLMTLRTMVDNTFEARVDAVPEPATASLIGAGLMVSALWRRRRHTR